MSTTQIHTCHTVLGVSQSLLQKPQLSSNGLSLSFQPQRGDGYPSHLLGCIYSSIYSKGKLPEEL